MADYSTVQKKNMMDRAHSAVLSRDYQLAARLYKGLLQNDPENISILSALGDLYERSGKDFESIPFYKSIVTIDPQNVDALNSLGAIYRRLGRFDESIDVLQKALIADENNIQIFYNLGSTYNLKGRLDNAIYCFTKVIETRPDDVLAYNHLGHVYAKQKFYDKAIATYSQGLKIDPNHPVLHLNLAKCYDKAGSVEKACKEYENAIRYKPGWNDAIETYADFLIRNNRSGEAKKLVNQAINLKSGNVQLHNKMGDIYAHQHDFSNAENEFKFVLDKKDDNKNALKGLANVYEADRKMVEAIHTMRLMEKNYPDDNAMLEQYAHILLSAENMNSASKKIKELWDKNQKDEGLLNLLAQYYVLKGDEGKVLGCFKRIESLNPFYKDHLIDCARRYAQTGNFEKALSYGEKYLKEFPNDSKALLDVAKYLEALGKKDEALDTYNKLVEKDPENLEYKSGLSRLKKDEVIPEETESGSLEESIAPDENIAPEIIDGVAVDDNIEDFASDFMEENRDASDVEAGVSDESSSEEPLEYKDSEFGFEKLTEDDTDVKNVFKKLDDEIEANGSIDDDEFGENLDALVDKDFDDDFISTYPKDKSGVPDIEEIDDGFDGEPSFENEDIHDDLGLDQGNYHEVSDGMNDEFDDTMESSGFDSVKDGLDQPLPQENFSQASDIADKPFASGASLSGDDLALSEEEDNLADFGNFSDIPSPIDDAALDKEKDEVDVVDRVRGKMEQQLPSSDNAALSDEEDNLADFGNFSDIPSPIDDAALDKEKDEVDVVDRVRGKMEEEASANDEVALSDEENNLADFAEAVAEPSGLAGDSVALSDEENNLADFAEAAVEPVATVSDHEALSDEENNLLDFENMDEIKINDERPEPEYIFDRTAETLDELASEVADESIAEKYNLIAKLFLELKELSNYLPPETKKAFFESEEHLQLEYIIGRLTGRRGLLATAESIRRKLGISDDMDKVTATGDELIRAVFTYMKSMISELPDSNVAANLNHHMDSAMVSM